jgi:hypothetical protein
MALHSSNSFEMPLLLSAFSNVLPQVICGQPIGRVCGTEPVSNYRGARLMGTRYVRRGQPNEDADYESNCRYQECLNDGSDSQK